MMKTRRYAGGFTLIEVMATLIVLGAFSLIAVKLFRASLDTARLVAETQRDMASFTHMTDELRADAWGAADMQCADAHRVVITRANQRIITWRRVVQEGGPVLERTIIVAGRKVARETWALRDDVAAMRVDGAVLTIEFHRGGAWSCVSQLRLASTERASP